ncbi:uncharacterized protein METZ01_LOCUS341967, partial [marine metagenome]
SDITQSIADTVRQKNGIRSFSEFDCADLNQLHDWLFDSSKARPIENPRKSLDFPTSLELNPSQEHAVRGALQAEDVFFIQGPPGTGKTTVIAEIINQATQGGKKVLLASQSNDAVDNALGKLSKSPNVRPIRRYGRSADPDPSAEKFLEGNVVSKFFVPSIADKCHEQHVSSLSKRSKNRAMNDLELLPKIKDEWTHQRGELESNNDAIIILRSQEWNLRKEKDRLEEDIETLDAAKGILVSRSEANLTPGMSALIDVDWKDIGELAGHEKAKHLFEANVELADHLATAQTTGTDDYADWAKKLHIITKNQGIPDHAPLIQLERPPDF